MTFRHAISGWAAERPIHVVAADSRKDDEIIVITVYEPDPALWEPGSKRRKPWPVWFAESDRPGRAELP